VSAKSVKYAFDILNAKFRIFEGPICCKEETVNSVIRASVVPHNFVRIRERLFCEGAEIIIFSMMMMIEGKDYRGYGACEISWLII
jgi:hypothetical protein